MPLIELDGLQASDISRNDRTRCQKSPMVAPLSTRSHADSMQLEHENGGPRLHDHRRSPVLSLGKLSDNLSPFHSFNSMGYSQTLIWHDALRSLLISRQTSTCQTFKPVPKTSPKHQPKNGSRRSPNSPRPSRNLHHQPPNRPNSPHPNPRPRQRRRPRPSRPRHLLHAQHLQRHALLPLPYAPRPRNQRRRPSRGRRSRRHPSRTGYAGASRLRRSRAGRSHLRHRLGDPSGLDGPERQAHARRVAG